MKHIRRIIGYLVRSVLWLFSKPVKASLWYQNLFVDFDHRIYPDNVWYREHDERNFDVVNLGSSSAKWAFDWSSVGVKGMNWANQPQTLIDDFRLLKNFHSILRKGGTVIITIMPFTGINKRTVVLDTLKYLPTLYWDVAQDMPHVDQARRLQSYPILMGKPAIKAGLRYVLGREIKQIDWRITSDYNPMSGAELETDAEKWMMGWTNQFRIEDFEAPLTEENLKGREVRVGVMQELIDFIVERGYRPIWVLPPVTRHLAKFFTPKFREIYIDSYLREVNRDVRLLDYTNDAELQDDSLYFNSFFLNAKGRHIFTKRVLNDLQLI